MAKGDSKIGALDTVGLFNSTSCPIGIMLGGGVVITLPPFSIVGTPMAREDFDKWKNTKIGQGYLDKGLVCTAKSDAVGFSKTSDLEVPPELKAMPTQGATEATLEQKPSLDGGVTLPVG